MIIIKSVAKLLYQELSVSSKKYYLLEKKEKKKWKEKNKKFRHLTKNWKEKDGLVYSKIKQKIGKIVGGGGRINGFGKEKL